MHDTAAPPAAPDLRPGFLDFLATLPIERLLLLEAQLVAAIRAVESAGDLAGGLEIGLHLDQDDNVPLVDLIITARMPPPVADL